MSSSRAVVPLRAGAGDRRVEALADVPQRGPRAPGRRSSGAGAVSGRPASSRARPRRRGRAVRRRSRLVLDQQRGVLVDVRAPRSTGVGLRVGLRRPAGTWRPSARWSPRRSPTSAGQRAGGRAAGSAKTSSAGAAARRSSGTVRNVASATNAERALAADDQVGEDLDGRVVVEEGVEAVAHRVLHRELLADDRGTRARRCRGRGRAAATRPCVQLGLAVRAAARRRRAAPVSTTVPLGSTTIERLQRAVGVRDGAAGHAAGVVGDDPADACRRPRWPGRGRACGRGGASRALTCRTVAPGCDAHAGAVVEHLDAAEVPAGVDEDAVGDRLAGQAGAAGAERQRHPGPPATWRSSLPTSAASRGTATACGVSR